MSKEMYIHYGSKTFIPEHVDPICNQSLFSKPIGGFWASPVKAEYGWKDWCTAEDFKCDFTRSFKFTLSDDAKVIHIRKTSDIMALPLLREDGTDGPLRCRWFATMYIDFEKLVSMGYDAIQLHLSGADRGDLYYALYGWDCDSILIMNPDIVEVIKEDE